MSAQTFTADTPPSGSVVPYASEFVTITKQEYIELVMQARYFKSLHQRALERSQWRESRLLRYMRQIKEQAAQREHALRGDLEQAQGKIRELQQRLFGRKSERHKTAPRQSRNTSTHAPRGHRPGIPSPGRSMQTNLPAYHETIALQTPQCPQCGQRLKPFPGTEDSEVLEIDVKAYRRVIHRQRYTPSCQCGCLPGIVCAPAPPKLIAKGKYGVSVWTHVLVDKFLHARPSQRLLQEMEHYGLQMSAGTLSGGLQAIAPLFAPVKEAFIDKLRSQLHWHADETRWAVFMHALYRAGHHWYLWVFHAPTVVHYVLHPSRAAQVVIDELQGVKSGVISCDRYSAYKKFARLNPGVVLAFCWAHQRRDFLDLATRHPAFEAWALQWVSDIGQLYHLNAVRLQTTLQSAERDAAQIALEQGMQRMAASLGEALADPALGSPARKVLQSMKAHWSGLSVFVKHPWVPMDNNVAERDERGPVVGRKNFYGSGAQWAGELAALMYSVFATLKLWGINPNTWLFDYLQACAENAQRAPSDISRFLPWAMDEARLAAMRNTQPAPVALAEVFDSS